MITEPDVTLTDYLIALESALFTYLLIGHGGQVAALGLWFAVFFGSVSLAAVAGGTVHGFFLDTSTLGYRVLWPLTLIAIGVTALSAWAIGARVYFSPKVAFWITVGAFILFAGYCLVVFFITQSFFVAVIHYLPATVFLTVVFLMVYWGGRETPVFIGLVGLLLTFVAAGVQQGGLSLHPIYFNHNALYHLIQAVALFMIFWTARWWVTAGTL
ncbi:MAG: hypothetical protein GTO40_09475 [Deltaproteobacteria bacterium]|nr:hypothetical protein [Deltaproteobacteria bacterium]